MEENLHKTSHLKMPMTCNLLVLLYYDVSNLLQLLSTNQQLAKTQTIHLNLEIKSPKNIYKEIKACKSHDYTIKLLE
jgi:hypothetical protein